MDDDNRSKLQRQLTVLQAASNDTQRRQAASFALQFVRQSLAAEDDDNDNMVVADRDVSCLSSVTDAVSALVAALGSSSDQLLESVLEMVRISQRRGEVFQVLLDAIPALAIAVEDDEEAHDAILETMRSLLGKVNPTALIPILDCLSQLSFKTHRMPILRLLRDALTAAAPTDGHEIVQEMLHLVTNEHESTWVWSILRKEPRLFGPTDPAQCDSGEVAHLLSANRAVVSALQAHKQGPLLAMSYLDLLESLRLQDEGNGSVNNLELSLPSLLDLLVPLALSSQSHLVDVADRWFDRCLSRRAGHLIRLLDYLVGVLNFEEPPFNLKNILVPGLLRIALLLLLAPLRGALLTDATKAAANQFVLQLHQHFNRDQQDELIRSILELFDASDTATRDFSFLESKSAIEETTVRSRTLALTDVKRSVLAALTGLAEASPASLIRFKHALLRRVASETAATSPEPTRELCKLLTMLVRESDSESDAIDASELYTLTHKLLFSGTFTRDSGRAARGVILATELLLCSRCSDKESIQAWVFRLLLPSTRRMMDPELGPPGLRFLEALQSQKSPPGRDGVFVHFKMILANTGLIQMLESFQATKREDASLLVYSDVPQMLKITMARNTRKMIFCVSFFLSHTVNMVNNPARWPFATHWVFELVDTYLQMGRQKSTVWRPEGWLVAPIQFPNPFPTNGAVRNLPKEVVDWIKCCCCRFHVMADSESTCCVPKERIRVMLACMDVQERLRLQESLSRFSLAMLIGISLSAAVLKNAFGHWKMQQSQRSESTSVLFRLIKFQLLKIYDLCEKSEHLDIAYTSTVTKQTRISRKKKAASSAAEDMSGNGVRAAKETTGKANDNENSSLLAKTSTSPSQARSLRLAMFTSHDTFDINVLCDVVFDRNDSETIRLCLDELSATSAQATRETIASCFCLIEFRTHLLRHICSLLGARPQAWVEGGSALCNDRVSHCLKAASFLLEAIPKLRRGYFAQVSRKEHLHENVRLSTVVRLLTWYLRLLASVLQYIISRQDSLSNCIEWFDIHPAASVTVSRSDASGRSRLFEYFCTLVPLATNSVVANHILEILSLIALDGCRSLLGELTEISWMVLHTVFVDNGTEFQPYDFIPSAVVSFCRHVKKESTSANETSLRDVFIQTVNRISSKDITDHLRYGLIRHWGVLLASNSARCQNLHFLKMIVELDKLLGSFEKAEISDDNSQPLKLKRHEVSSIMGLEAATFPVYFEVLIQIVVASSVSLAPDPCDSVASGPYRHIQEGFVLFRHLIELYKKHFMLFPRACGPLVSSTCKDVLVVTTAQVDRCVVWRSAQPMLTAEERMAGKCDVGALRYMQHLLDDVYANTAETILGLCNFWRSRTSDTKAPRSTTLRYTAENTSARIRAVATAHSLIPPVSGALARSRDCESQQLVEGYSNGLDESGTTDFMRSVHVSQATRFTHVERPAALPNTDSDDSEGSFVAQGGWGSDSESDMSLQCEGLVRRS